MNEHTKNLAPVPNPRPGVHTERVQLRVELLRICKIIHKRYSSTESDIVICIKFN